MSSNSWFEKLLKPKKKEAKKIVPCETKKEEKKENKNKKEKGIVITIGRELGSGGRKIAKEVAKRLNLEYYDKEIITKAAKENGIDENLFKQVDEADLDSFWYEFSVNAYEKEEKTTSYKEMAAADKLFMVQSDAIRDIAKEGGAVIVGRCATYILKNNSKKVFICANEKDRIERIEKSYKVDPQKAKEIMEISDKKRENYHTYYTNQDWKDKKNYDLVINTSEIGIEKAIEEVIRLAKS